MLCMILVARLFMNGVVELCMNLVAEFCMILIPGFMCAFVCKITYDFVLILCVI